MSILQRLLGRFFGAFFADLFFNLTTPFARKPWPKEAVKQISEKEDRRHPFVIHRRKDEDEENNQKSRNGFFRFPIDRLETGVLETAEHHEGKEEQEGRQNEFPFAEMVLAFSQPQQK